MSVSLARRKGPASSAGNPATLIVASRSGVFNDRGWEARIPVIEHEGEILIDDRDEIGMLLANSNKSGSAGYLYAYPMRLRALLGAAAVAILHIANDASMQSGRTEYRSDGQGWTPVFYPKDRYEQLELLTWWFGEQKERFHKEAHEERKYVAFRTSENEDGNGMIVKGIRKRELNPAPFDRNYMTHEYTERSTEIEALASLGHDEAMSLIAGLEDNAYHAVTEVLSSRWIEVNFEASAQRFLDAKYELTIETEGVWKHPHFNNSSDDINLKLLIRFEEQPDGSRAICGKGTMTGNCNGNKFAQHVEGPVAEALFREFAVKRGIVVACKRGLVELEGETGIYGLQEDELADGTSILTCTSEDEAMKVTVDHNLGCIALSFSRYTRRGNTWKSSWHEKNKEQAFEWFMADVAASKEPVFYFVAGSDNKTRKSLVDGRELLATSLTPADILYLARQRGVNMPEMVVEKALPGQRGLLVRTGITK